ncbi:type II toxin-antitoxin system toxin DNA ADP-ribosyl transferase DarT [Streptomyces sp. P9-A2]|uniref:type II toxin-antitoxin system toxin DNA ADP-ribosyl transferase DarT n=1 Tax=Streptomyces sp. P9-A2 TaxID=3072284 RepID=UPI002FC84BE2
MSVVYSALVTNVGERRLFHFTHVRNLRDILTEKQLVSDTVMQGRGGVLLECGDREVKAERRTRRITVPPYGCPADYVPFYFAPRSPMLYVISRGGVPTYREGQTPLVYLVTSVGAVVESGRPFVFSDGNCANEITQHFTTLGEMPTVVDWEIMAARYWANTADDGDRMRRRMAELLVLEHLPVTALHEVGAYDHAHAQQAHRLLREAGAELPLSVRREWYY